VWGGVSERASDRASARAGELSGESNPADSMICCWCVQNADVCLRLVETVRDGHLCRDWRGMLFDVEDSKGREKNLKDCVRDADGKVACASRPPAERRDA
jgi:hypothetical protein